MERTYASRFRGGELWLAWVWPHGGRAVLERIPAKSMGDAAAAAFRALDPARTADGSLVICTPIRFTRAHP